MEPYPLADAPPPRYAVESDDEDEHNPLSAPTASNLPLQDVEVEFKSVYDIPSKRPLIFASGEAGVSWAKIVNLGEQLAGIYVDKLRVGLLFSPSWTSTIIVVSEAETRTRLPLFAMTTYTTAVIEYLQPTRVAILDSYPTHMYISSQVNSQENVPIRYLSVGENPVPSDSELELFAPPNLLQSTTASLLNGLFLYSHGINQSWVMDAATLVLLPSSKVPSPLPMTIGSKEATGGFGNLEWDRERLEKTHTWLFAIVGQRGDKLGLWPYTELATRIAETLYSALREVGEGSMYI